MVLQSGISCAVYVCNMSVLQGVGAAVYLCMLLVMRPLFMILYLMCGMYTVEGVWKQPGAVYGIVRANVAGVVILFWLFYFMKLDFPRMIILLAGIINLVLGGVLRTFILRAR